MIMFKYILALALLVLPASTAMAQSEDEWVFVSTSETETDFYIRRSDVMAGRSDSTAARMWVRMDHSKDAGISWRYSVIRYSVNCLNESFVQTSFTSYQANGKAESSPVSGNREYVIPGSHMDTMTKLVCSDTYPRWMDDRSW